MTKEVVPQAFPKTGYFNESGSACYDSADSDGMTLRDYFAAKAMAALMPIYWETQEEYQSAKEMVKCQVESAYAYADAMILQRGK